MAQVDPCPPEPPQPQIDYAPESFWLSKDAELDWLDRNAFMERKDSGKASHSSNLNPSVGSNRYSATSKSKPSIIGLPKATKPNYAEANNRRRHCKPPSIRLFPKRTESKSGGGGGGMSEPSSPKVSCMGRVRSKKERSRRGKKNNRNNKGNETGGIILVRNKSVNIKDRKSKGFWNNFRSIFKPNNNHHHNKKDESAVAETDEGSKKKRGFDSNNNGKKSSSLAIEAPGLGGVKRFASGRRSDAWAAEVEVEEKGGGPIWRRRNRDVDVENVEVQRDWQSVGPASV